MKGMKWPGMRKMGEEERRWGEEDPGREGGCKTQEGWDRNADE